MRDEQDVRQAGEDIGNQVTGEILSQLGTFMDNIVSKGVPPKEALGVSDEKITQIYSQAYQLYNSGNFEEATHLFRLLMVLEPTEPKHYMGVAASLHMLKQYENAVKAYTFASIVDPENPVPHFHASDCYIKMRDKASAIIMLDMAIQRAGEKPEYQILKERALLTLDALKKELQSNKVD